MHRVTLSVIWLSIALSSITSVRLLGLTMSDWLFMIGLVCCILQIGPIVRFLLNSPPKSYYLGCGLLLVGCVVSRGPDIQTTDVYLYAAKLGFTFLLFIPLLGLVAPFSKNARVYDGFYTAWIIAGSSAGAFSLLQYLNGGYLFGAAATWGRMTGLTEHPNELGLVTALALPIAIHRIIARAGVWETLKNGSLIGLILLGLLFSQSMTAAICAVIGAGAVIVSTALYSGSRKRSFYALATLIIASSVIPFVAQDTLNDFELRITTTRGGEQETTLDTRIAGLRELLADGEIFKITGTGVYAVTDSYGNAAHNIYIRAYVELGIFGALGLGILTFTLLRFAIRNVRGGDPINANVSVAVMWSYVIFLLAAQSSPVLFQRNLWVPAMLVFAIYKNKSAAPRLAIGRQNVRRIRNGRGLSLANPPTKLNDAL